MFAGMIIFQNDMASVLLDRGGGQPSYLISTEGNSGQVSRNYTHELVTPYHSLSPLKEDPEVPYPS